MANIRKSSARESKNHKARNGMRVSNRNIFVVVATIGNKSNKRGGK
jgi:hypothetical protein